MPDEPQSAAVTTVERPETVASHMASLAPPEKQNDGPSLTEILAALPDVEHRDQYVQLLVAAEANRLQFRLDWQLAYQFATCGAFNDLKNLNPRQGVALAMTKIQLGRSWKMEPADAVRHVYFVQGRPNVEIQIIAAKLRDAGYDWDIEWHWADDPKVTKATDRRCIGATLWIKQWNEAVKAHLPVLDRKGDQVSYSYTEADANRVKTRENNQDILLSQKSNYQQYPMEMYMWRAVGRLHKFHAPQVLRGAVPRADQSYGPVEDVIDVEPVTVAEEPPPEAPKPSLKDLAAEQLRRFDEKP